MKKNVKSNKNIIPMREDASSTVQATNNLEYVNLMEYLPMRLPATEEEERNRKKVTSREFIDHDDGEFDNGHDDM